MKIIVYLIVLLGVAAPLSTASAAGTDSSTDASSWSQLASQAELRGRVDSDFEVFAVQQPASANDSVAAAQTWTCHLKTNRPHYSAPTPGVIAKAQVRCFGPAARLPINVYMMLGRTTTPTIASLRTVKESQYTQVVTVNGRWSNPWYVPRSGSGASRGAWFRAASSAAAAPPLLPINIGAHASQFVRVD